MKSVKESISLPVDPNKALNMFLDLKEMRSWWGVERGFIDPKPGGCWTVAWEISEKGFGYVSTGVIKEIQLGKNIVIENLVYLNPAKSILGPMTLDIKVEEAKENTILTVEQSGYGEGDDWFWYYNAVVEGWPHALKLLRNHCLAKM